MATPQSNTPVILSSGLQLWRVVRRLHITAGGPSKRHLVPMEYTWNSWGDLSALEEIIATHDRARDALWRAYLESR